MTLKLYSNIAFEASALAYPDRVVAFTRCFQYGSNGPSDLCDHRPGVDSRKTVQL